MLRETTDIGLAAYIRLRIKRDPSLGIENTNVSGERGGRFSFIFNDPNDMFEKLSMQYSTSESFAFDNEIRVLKTLLKSK